MSPSFFKRSGASAIRVVEATKQQINAYVQALAGQGYVMLGTPIEFRVPMGLDGLRDSAKQYAVQNGCSLVVEVKDPNPMSNPYNPYKFYLFQYQGGEYQPPQPFDPNALPAAQARQQIFAEFVCPHCRNKFTAYVNPGRNMLQCTRCRGQSVVDVPSPDAAAQVNQQTSTSKNDVARKLAAIKLKSSYNTLDEMLLDCLEALSKILFIEGNPIPFNDTGEFLYPFNKMKEEAYQHIGFRKMDMVLLKEATHDFKIIGSEQHSQSQANVNPHKDDLFSIKVLGSYNYLVLDQFKMLEDEQKQQIANGFYQFLTQFVGVAN
ncbi:MAG: hypothetical protein ACMUIG_01400 [Thermoplasmatota archaeon]